MRDTELPPWSCRLSRASNQVYSGSPSDLALSFRPSSSGFGRIAYSPSSARAVPGRKASTAHRAWARSSGARTGGFARGTGIVRASRGGVERHWVSLLECTDAGGRPRNQNPGRGGQRLSRLARSHSRGRLLRSMKVSTRPSPGRGRTAPEARSLLPGRPPLLAALGLAPRKARLSARAPCRGCDDAIGIEALVKRSAGTAA